MTIEERIIHPIQNYIEGGREIFRFPIVQRARDCIRDGRQSELHQTMEPYYCMYRDDSSRIDWTMRSIIADIARIDPYFGDWVSRQDLMKMAQSWAVRGSGDELLELMDVMINANFEPMEGDRCYSEVTEELRYQRVNYNNGSGEVFALMHAFITVMLSSHRHERHKMMFQLMKEHWDFLRHLYSVLTGSIIGFGFTNFVSLANNLKTAKYHPYLHLVYWFLADNADSLCSKKQQKGMIKALVALQEIMDRTDPNHELDKLCQLLFAEEVKEMLIKHPKTPYRQLESENHVLKEENHDLKKENSELKAERSILKEKLEKLAQEQDETARELAGELQRAFVEDVIPFIELEEELLELPPASVGSVFSILNDMLGGNEVWQKHFKSLRAKVRKREKEKDASAQPTVQGDYIAGNKVVDKEVGNVAAGGTGINETKEKE